MVFLLNTWYHLKHGKIKIKEGNIIKDLRNIFRLQKEIDENTIKDTRTLFRLKTKVKESKTR